LIEAASLLVDDGRPADARALLQQASRSRASDVRLHQRLAEVLARWGDDEAALAEARTLVRLEPRDPEHRALVGDLLLARGDRAGALTSFHEMLELDPSAAGHDRLGTTLADHDLLEEARTELLAAHELAPDDRTIATHLEEVLVRSGRDADAEPLASRIVTLSGSDAALSREARASLVSIWARRHTLDRHIATLEAAFAGAPPDREAGALLAEALRRSGALARAEDVLVRLASLEENDADTWTTLERIRTLRGDLAGAIDALEHAAAADPPRAATYLARMSDDALALYRDEDAIRYAERALALSPDDAHGHVRLGDLHRRRHETDAAMASYRRALALDADLHEVALTLAQLTRDGGQPAAADALYAHVIAASPDDDLVARAIDASLEIELAQGSAEPLLDRLLTQALASFQRPVLTRSALAVLDVIARPLLPRAEGTGADADAARAELHRVASRGLGVLLRALSSADPSEQGTAIAILAAARVESAAPALLTASDSHGDAGVGLDALLAAARVATPALIPRLQAIASSADVPRARIATWGLVRMGGPDAVRALAALADGANAEIAALAAIGLGRDGTAIQLANIRRAGARHGLGPSARAPFVLAEALLGQSPESLDCATLVEAGGHARAVGLLVCPDADARARTLLLGGAETPRAIRSVVHVPGDARFAWPEPLAGEPPVALALRAIDAAPPHPLDPALPAALAAAVREGLAASVPWPAVSALAARDGHLALGLVDGPLGARLLADHEAEVLDALPALAGDPQVRARVAVLLAALRPDDARFEGLLADTNREVRRAALAGLEQRTEIAPALAAPLATILETSDDWVARIAAARALGRVTQGGEDALVHALAGDAFAFVREAAATALGARAGTIGLAELRAAAAGDPEEQVRAAAEAALRSR
jgi:tetratricopeptide (TPR) repeat protein